MLKQCKAIWIVSGHLRGLGFFNSQTLMRENSGNGELALCPSFLQSYSSCVNSWNVYSETRQIGLLFQIDCPCDLASRASGGGQLGQIQETEVVLLSCSFCSCCLSSSWSRRLLAREDETEELVEASWATLVYYTHSCHHHSTLHAQEPDHTQDYLLLRPQHHYLAGMYLCHVCKYFCHC